MARTALTFKLYANFHNSLWILISQINPWTNSYGCVLRSLHRTENLMKEIFWFWELDYVFGKKNSLEYILCFLINTIYYIPFLVVCLYLQNIHCSCGSAFTSVHCLPHYLHCRMFGLFGYNNIIDRGSDLGVFLSDSEVELA